MAQRRNSLFRTGMASRYHAESHHAQLNCRVSSNNSNAMPELPEVETMCRGIRPIVGSRVISLERPPCKRRPILIEPRIDQIRRRLEGKSVARIERVGKRVVIWFSADKHPSQATSKNTSTATIQKLSSADQAIIIEPRMTGLVLLADPPSQEHLRLRIKLLGSKAHDLLFWDRRGLGTVRLMSAHDFKSKFRSDEATLGPDALAISIEQLRLRLCRSRRAVKVALLDQRAVAGIGNLYASEILHLAGIHPEMRCNRISKVSWERIHGAMIEVLQTAIRYEGSTLADGTYRNALNQDGGYQNQHRVYDRAGRNCAACGNTIVRIVQAQRSTFFCTKCQRRK